MQQELTALGELMGECHTRIEALDDSVAKEEVKKKFYQVLLLTPKTPEHGNLMVEVLLDLDELESIEY